MNGNGNNCCHESDVTHPVCLFRVCQLLKFPAHMYDNTGFHLMHSDCGF